MFIVDYNQVALANFLMMIGKHTNVEVNVDLFRHFILNSIRSYNSKYRDKYGEMIIATDHTSWRHDVFPYYKANRKTDREASELDWVAVFKSLNQVREELKEFFPYRVLNIKGAEADDIIGTLCQAHANTNEKIMILSGDKDFGQLQVYLNVEQYDPVRKKKIVKNDPEAFLKEHIIRGDAGDGIPNFLSPDDCLVVKTRQKQITQKKLDVWLTQEPEQFCTPEMLRGYRRNEQLIDLSFTPQTVRDAIMKEMDTQKGKGRKHLFDFFVKHKLKLLMENIQDF